MNRRSRVKPSDNLAFLILRRYEERGISKGWNREQFYRLCQLANCLPEEIGALCCLTKAQVMACMKTNRFSATVSLHLEIIQAVILEAQCGKAWKPIVPIKILSKKILSGKTPEKKQQPETETKEKIMHYRNGRVAKNGDKIVQIPLGGKYAAQAGILYDAVPGNDSCNGRLAITNQNDSYVNLKECLHIEDVAASTPADSSQPEPAPVTQPAPLSTPDPTLVPADNPVQSALLTEWVPPSETKDNADTQG